MAANDRPRIHLEPGHEAGDQEVAAGITRGLADAVAGCVVPHGAAMDQIDAAIDAVARGLR
jgi:predicted transcriptional regulator